MHLLLGNTEKVMTLFDEYVAFSSERYHRSQDSAHILGVSNLFSQIEQLETEIKKQEMAKQRLLYGGIAITATIFVAFGLYARRKYLAQLSIDPTTQLLNSKTTISRIAKLRAPDEGKTNAIALFDLVNFKAINRAVGSTNSEQMLRKIALSFSSVTRDTDVLGRFAPEQFVLCLHNIEERNARLFFQRVKNALDMVEFQTDRGNLVTVDSVMSIYTSTEKFSDLDTVFDDMQLSLDIQNQN
jgi:diguanylate cyclase (GGDEF)-like protein